MQLRALGEEIGRDLSARGESVGAGVENMDSGPGFSTYLGQVAYPTCPHLYGRRVWLDMF